MITDTFRPGRSPLHLYDPRAKLVVLLALVVFFFLPVPVLFYAPYLLLLAVLIALSLELKELGRPIAAILPILVLVTVLTPPFHRGGQPLVEVSGWVLLTTGGLEETGRLLMRFTGITLGFYLFFRVTSIDRVVLALRWFGLPFKASLVVTLAFRYLPYLLRVYASVRDAHRLRAAGGEGAAREGEGVAAGGKGAAAGRERGGARVGAHRHGPVGRLRAFLPVLTSVLIVAIKGIPELAMALETRGLGRAGRRTMFLSRKTGPALILDFALAILVIGLLALPVLLM